MLRRFSPLPALLPALLIGGCTGTKNRGLESVHQAVVSRQDLALDLQAGGGGLAPGEAARLDGWLGAMRLRYGDRVAVDDPSSYGGARAEIARVVARYGLLVGDERPVGPGPATPGGVRVVVSRLQAYVPGCPDWTRNSSYEYNSNTSSNFGCGVNSSLTAMVANPEDLLHGQSAGTTDQLRAGKAIDAFRKASLSGGGGNAVSAGGGK